MSKFNKTKVHGKPNATTYEGAPAFEKSLEKDWLNNLFSNMLENRFYESAEEQMGRYIELTEKMLEKYGPKFVARASHFSRNELGLRSISQLTAAMLNSQKFDGKRDFFKNYMKRPDDVSEIFSILDSFGEKRSHALVRGAGDYLSNLSSYSLDKYSMKNKDWSMYDLINITHANSKNIDDFKCGTIKKANTWEQLVSNAKSNEERNGVWHMLVETEQLGYLALIRNLSNILESDVDASWVEKYLVHQIVDETAIRKSLVFPYQIYVAYKNLRVKEVQTCFALNKAFRISIGNMPHLKGNSLVVLDVSGSMDYPISSHSDMSIKEVGAVYAAALYLANENTEFIKFGTKAKKQDFNRLDNVFTVIKKMQKNDNLDMGTNINAVWKMLDKHYDRIFLISDMQVMSGSLSCWWWGHDTADPIDCMNQYMKDFGDSNVYSFDLGNYSTQVDNPNRGRLHMLTALNDKVFKMLEIIEDGGNIVDYINSKYADII